MSFRAGRQRATPLVAVAYRRHRKCRACSGIKDAHSSPISFHVSRRMEAPDAGRETSRDLARRVGRSPAPLSTPSAYLAADAERRDRGA